MSPPIRQHGAVLIVAMLIVALAATTAAFMLEKQDLSVRQLAASRDYEQARWLLKGGTHWARSILAQDARSGALDHARELWASGLPPTQIEQATLSGEIRDPQGLFNLANLARDGKPSARDIAILRRLLQAIGLRAELADAIAERWTKQPFTELGELHDVRGCDEAAIARLRPFATVLPQRTPVNVNTAPPQVLAALVEGLSVPEAQAVASGRAAAPIRDAADFRARLPRPELRASDEDLSVQTQFFLVHGRVTLGKADVRLEALLQRRGTALPSIVWQRMS